MLPSLSLALVTICVGTRLKDYSFLIISFLAIVHSVVSNLSTPLWWKRTYLTLHATLSSSVKTVYFLHRS